MKKVLQHCLVISFFLAMTLVMTWPVASHMQAAIAGSGGDPWQTLWRFETKAAGGLPEFWRDITGSGEARLVNLSVWPWMPLHLAFGQPIAYNSIWLVSFVLSGYAMYLLVEYLIGKGKSNISLPALLAGLYYMLLPYHAAHALGHFGAMQMQWLPFIVLVGLRWFKKPTFGNGVVLALLLIVQAWSEHHYMLWLPIGVIVSVIYWWQPLRSTVQKHSRLYFTQAALLVVLCLFGIVIPYIPTVRLALVEDTHLELGRDQLVRFSADIFSFIVPASFHPLWGNLSHALFSSSFTGNVSESTHYLGISVLLLLLFFHSHIPLKIKKYWTLLAVVFAVIALGPKFHIFGTITSIPLPYALLDSWPGISSVRAVARASSIVGLSVAVLLGYMLEGQLRRRGAAVAFGVLLLIEFLFMPVSLQSASLSPAYERLKEVGGTTILEIPAATNYTAASRSLYAGTIHGKEVLGNIALERAISAEEFSEAKQMPGIRQLLYLRTTELREGGAEFLQQDLAETLPDAMRAIDAEAIVVHRDSLSHFQFATIQSFLEQSLRLKAESFDDVLVYIIPPEGIATDGVVVRRDSGWQNVGFDAKREATFAEVSDVAHLRFINVTDTTKTIRVQFPLAPESKGTLEIQAAGLDINANQSFLLPPGEVTVTVRRVGSEKAIVMNPKFTAQ